MAIALTVRNVVFQYPDNKEPRGWGEDATAWAEAITSLLSDVIGDADIPPSLATITAGAINQPISALEFSTLTVRSAIVEYAVTRGTLVESGEIRLVYNGTTWDIATEFIGDASIQFTIDPSGQVKYSSSASPAGTGTIKFRARTLEQ
jgi:hypothetical protein